MDLFKFVDIDICLENIHDGPTFDEYQLWYFFNSLHAIPTNNKQTL